jgi:hypothetical protein
MLARLHMSVEEASDEFFTIVEVYSQKLSPHQREHNN